LNVLKPWLSGKAYAIPAKEKRRKKEKEGRGKKEKKEGKGKKKRKVLFLLPPSLLLPTPAPCLTFCLENPWKTPGPPPDIRDRAFDSAKTETGNKRQQRGIAVQQSQ